MYVTLSYDVTTGAKPVDAVRSAVTKAFTGCVCCDLLADTFIARVKSTAEYLDLVQALKRIAKDFEGQFLWVFTLHDSGAALRSNAPVAAKLIEDIIKDDES
jgi:hypothetical protein